MSFKLSQVANVTQAFQTQNVNANSLYSTWYPMSNYDRIMFAVDLGNINSGTAGVLALEARQATGTNGTTNKAVSTVTNVAVTTANSIGVIEIRADELDTDNVAPYWCAAVRVVESNSNISTVSGVAIRTSARFPQATALG